MDKHRALISLHTVTMLVRDKNGGPEYLSL